MASNNFESSFSQILNRTQQNLNRINQRYSSVGSSGGSGALTSGSGVTSSLQFSTVGIPSTSGVAKSTDFRTSSSALPPVPLLSSQSLNTLNAGNPTPSILQKSVSLSQSQSRPGLYQQPPPAGSVPANSYSNSTQGGKGMITLEEDVVQSILQRLTYLEKTVEDHQLYSQQINTNEKFCKSIDQHVNDVLLEMKDLHRQFSQQQNRVTVLQSICDSVTLEQEQRKIAALKIDNWIRDTENWREEMNGVLSTLKRQETMASRSQLELRQQLSDSYVTKQDFETFRDKVYLSVQQSVAASLSAWNESQEAKIKQLEREIAILKLGQTKAVQSEMHSLTKQAAESDKKLMDPTENVIDPEVVARVLQTPNPSEMVIKGAVSVEVRNLENQLESKLESRLLNLLNREISQSKQSLINHINHQVLSICTDSLLFSDLTTANAAHLLATTSRSGVSVPGSASSVNFAQMLQLNNSLLTSLNPESRTIGSGEEKVTDAPTMSDEQLRMEFERRVMNGKNKIENLERKISDKLKSIEDQLLILREKSDGNNKDLLMKVVHLETKLENQQEVMQQQLGQSQQKFHSTDTVIKDQEIKLKELMEKFQQTTTEKLHNMNSDFMNERLSLEKRLIIVERIAQDSLEQQKRSQEILHQSILSHPTILQLNQSLKEMNQYSQELSLLKQELRSVANDQLKLQSTTVPMHDFLPYKEKLHHCDHVIRERLPEYFESQKKLLEFSSTVTSKQEHYDFLLNRMNTEAISAANKVETLNLQMIQVQGNVTTMTEETKLLKTRVTNLETSTTKEIYALKDLSGSLASRLQTNENKIITLNRTQMTETASILQQLKLVDEKFEFYEKMMTSAPRYSNNPSSNDPTTATTTTTTTTTPSALAALGKSNTMINVAPLSLLSSTVPLAVSMDKSTTSESSKTDPVAKIDPTSENEKPVAVVVEKLDVKSDTIGSTTATSSTSEMSKGPTKTIIKQELRGVPPVLVTTVVEDKNNMSDEVESFEALESSFDLLVASLPTTSNKGIIPPLTTNNNSSLLKSQSAIPEDSRSHVENNHTLTVSSIPVVSSHSQSSLFNQSSSLLNSMSMISDPNNQSLSHQEKASTAQSMALQKPHVPVGKVPNEWDGESFDSPIEKKKPPLSTLSSPLKQSENVLEDSFAATEEGEGDHEEEDHEFDADAVDRLMTSLPHETSDDPSSPHQQEDKEEEEEDHKSESGSEDSSDDDFDQLTEQIASLKQHGEQNLSKYTPTKTTTTTTAVDNSFDESTTASPVKATTTATAHTSAKNGGKEEEEGEVSFDEDVDSVLDYDHTSPQKGYLPTATATSTAGGKGSVKVPTLPLASLTTTANTNNNNTNNSSEGSEAPKNRSFNEDSERLDSTTNSPTKISTFPTTTATNPIGTVNRFEQSVGEMSDWDASIDTSHQASPVKTTLPGGGRGGLEPKTASASASVSAANSSQSSSNLSRGIDQTSMSHLNQSYVTNSFDQSSAVINNDTSLQQIPGDKTNTSSNHSQSQSQKGHDSSSGYSSFLTGSGSSGPHPTSSNRNSNSSNTSGSNRDTSQLSANTSMTSSSNNNSNKGKGAVIPPLSLESIKKEDDPTATIAPIASRPTVTEIPTATGASHQLDQSSYLENSFDESSVDVSMDLVGKTTKPLPPVATTTASKETKLELDTKEILSASVNRSLSTDLPPVSSTSSSVVSAPSPTPGIAPASSTDKQAIRDRLRARQEALKQQRSTNQSSSSSTPMRSRASSPPPATAVPPGTTAATNTTTANTTITTAAVQKKPSILDNLDEEDSSFSSESNTSKQRVSTMKPTTTTTLATTAATAKKPTTTTTTSNVSAGDEIQAFEEIDDSSFDF